MKEHPICMFCEHCLHCDHTGRVRRVNCEKNENLGAVTEKYKKCPSYQELSIWIDND